MEYAFQILGELSVISKHLVILGIAFFWVVFTQALAYAANPICRQFYGQTSAQRLDLASQIIQEIVGLAKAGKYSTFEYRSKIDEAMYLLTQLELEWNLISRSALNTTDGRNLPVVIKSFLQTMLASDPKWDLLFESKLEKAEAFVREINNISREISELQYM